MKGRLYRRRRNLFYFGADYFDRISRLIFLNIMPTNASAAVDTPAPCNIWPILLIEFSRQYRHRVLYIRSVIDSKMHHIIVNRSYTIFI